MALRLPSGYREILADGTNFLKRDKPVIKRLNDSIDGHYISALHKIDDIIRKHEPVNLVTGEPIFKDPYLGQWWVFCGYLVPDAHDYSQEKADDIRNSREDFANKMKNISAAAAELSKLIQKANLLGEKFGFSENADVHPLGLLQSTIANQSDAETRYRFNHWVAENIEQARSFDLKYFPSITEILDEISRQYAQGFEITESAAVAGSTSKNKDFCLQFFEHLRHSIELNQLPECLQTKGVVTYANWAAIFSVALNHSVTVDDIKYLRRKKSKV
jgi:hypothetical protein